MIGQLESAQAAGQYIGPAGAFGLHGPPRVALPSRRARDPKMAALPMAAASPGDVNPDLRMNGMIEPRMVKSITSKK